MEIGRGRCLKDGERIAVLTIGTVGNFASEAIARMEADGIRVAHYDLRFAKPLDQELLHEVGRKFRCVVTVEDGACAAAWEKPSSRSSASTAICRRS